MILALSCYIYREPFLQQELTEHYFVEMKNTVSMTFLIRSKFSSFFGLGDFRCIHELALVLTYYDIFVKFWIIVDIIF